MRVVCGKQSGWEDRAKVSIRRSEEDEVQEAIDVDQRDLLFEAWITRFVHSPLRTRPPRPR
jgi:hypothetical protein